MRLEKSSQYAMPDYNIYQTQVNQIRSVRGTNRFAIITAEGRMADTRTHLEQELGPAWFNFRRINDPNVVAHQTKTYAATSGRISLGRC